MGYLDSAGLETLVECIKNYVQSRLANYTASKATADAAGNNIASTYATKSELNSYLTKSGTAADSAKLGGVAAANYAQLASPEFTGTPTAPTAAAGTNTTQVATTAFVRSEVTNLIDSAPATLDTLSELASALGNNPNFATTVTTQIGNKIDASSADYIKSASVSNNTLTLTKGNNTTVTFTAPEPTDTKVTNTLGTTTKFYITGTTSTTTNTGTQYFDTGVYVTATAGNLYATTFNTGGNITMGGTSGTSYIQLPSGIKLY